MFLEKSIPSLNFATRSSLDDRTLMCECDSMLHDDWLDIYCVIILRSFCFKPAMVSGKNTWRNIFHNYISMLISQGHYSKRWKLMLSPESACFKTKCSSLGNLRIALQVGEVVSPLTPTFVFLSQDSHNEIYNIYDKHIHLQPPFQSFYEQEVWGGWRSRVWQCWRDQWIQEISHTSMDLMGVGIS